jgi:hypothetical protein
MGIILTSYEIYTAESVADGDANERGWLADKEPSIRISYNVEEAIELLQGCEPSSSQFHKGVWYSNYGEMDYITGETENLSYHLVKKEWSEEEELTIYKTIIRV